jgi:hypothetical protein
MSSTHRRLSSHRHPRLIKIETIPLNPLAMKGEYVMSVAVRPAREQAVHESAIPAPATYLRVRSATHTAPSIWYIAAEIKTSTGGALLPAPPAGTPMVGRGYGHQDGRPRDGVHVPGQLARTATDGHGVIIGPVYE